jgi:hypothetical protein
MHQTQAEAKRLDPVVRNVLGDNEVALTSWARASAPIRKRRRTPGGPDPDPAPPAVEAASHDVARAVEAES